MSEAACILTLFAAMVLLAVWDTVRHGKEA